MNFWVLFAELRNIAHNQLHENEQGASGVPRHAVDLDKSETLYTLWLRSLQKSRQNPQN